MVHHRVDGVFQFEDFTFNIDGDFLGQIARRNCSGHSSDVAHLRREIGRHGVDVVAEVLPYACQPTHISLSAQLAFGTDFARYAGDLRSERAELVHHGVDRGF